MKIFFIILAAISFLVSFANEETTSKAAQFLFAASSVCAIALQIMAG